MNRNLALGKHVSIFTSSGTYSGTGVVTELINDTFSRVQLSQDHPTKPGEIVKIDNKYLKMNTQLGGKRKTKKRKTRRTR